MNVLCDCVIKKSMWDLGTENPGLSHFLKHHVCNFEKKKKRQTLRFSVSIHERDMVDLNALLGCPTSISLSSQAFPFPFGIFFSLNAVPWNCNLGPTLPDSGGGPGARLSQSGSPA